jgi:hypothetical protein
MASRIAAPHPREVLSPVVGVVTPAESLEQRLKHDAEATRVGLSAATRKAIASLAEREGDEVVYFSARLKDVVSSAAQLHGWNQPAVNVNIANIPMPTEEARTEMPGGGAGMTFLVITGFAGPGDLKVEVRAVGQIFHQANEQSLGEPTRNFSI